MCEVPGVAAQLQAHTGLHPATCNPLCSPNAAEALTNKGGMFCFRHACAGKPKGVLHTTGGYAVGAAMTTKLVFDVQPESDVYWCTADCGWITGHTYVTYGERRGNSVSNPMHAIWHYPNTQSMSVKWLGQTCAGGPLVAMHANSHAFTMSPRLSLMLIVDACCALLQAHQHVLLSQLLSMLTCLYVHCPCRSTAARRNSGAV